MRLERWSRSFSSSRASIWRTRSLVMPYLVPISRRVTGESESMEIPEFIEARRAFPPEKVVFLGISLDQDQSQYFRFVKQTPFNFPVHLADPDVLTTFGVKMIPKTLVYDTTGQQALNHGFARVDPGFELLGGDEPIAAFLGVAHEFDGFLFLGGFILELVGQGGLGQTDQGQQSQGQGQFDCAHGAKSFGVGTDEQNA